MNHYRVTTFQSGEICVIHFNGHMQLFFVTGFFYAIPFTVYNIRKRNRRQQKRYAMQKLKCANRRLLVMNINNADILHYIGIHHDNIQGPPPPPTHTHCQLQVRIWSVRSLQHYHTFHLASNTSRHMFCSF